MVTKYDIELRLATAPYAPARKFKPSLIDRLSYTDKCLILRMITFGHSDASIAAKFGRQNQFTMGKVTAIIARNAWLYMPDDPDEIPPLSEWNEYNNHYREGAAELANDTNQLQHQRDIRAIKHVRVINKLRAT